MKWTNPARLMLQLGLAFVFLYAAIAAFVHPLDWVGYLPGFLRQNAHATPLLHVFSVGEIILALWLLSGKYLKYAAILSAVTFLGITIFNFDLFVVTFRDVALVFAALALYFSSE